MIRVLIVDDSLTTREYLKHVIDADPALFLIGEAASGNEAVDKVKYLKPDVVIMDIQMPGMDGYAATREIMENHPVPIVIHSTLVSPEQSDNIFAAMSAGAVAVAEKPPGIGHPESGAITRKLLRTVKLMSEVRVVQRKKIIKDRPSRVRQPSILKTAQRDREIVCIGASTGGPPVIQIILSGLDDDFSLPVIVVQHIAKGFLSGMIHWLESYTKKPMLIARTGDYLRDGHIYFAPEDINLKVTRNKQLINEGESPVSPLKRPITHLFSSVARAYSRGAIAVLLTGMGNDGAVGLKELRDSGAATIVQDRDSSVIFGMPGEAIKLDAADLILTPEEIITYLNSIMKVKRRIG
ncbi:MAG: response regulator [Deltaproteobacteria bacterium]|nr:response regulator [Deltaproteobacteria bacterium]